MYFSSLLLILVGLLCRNTKKNYENCLEAGKHLIWLPVLILENARYAERCTLYTSSFDTA